VKGIHGRNEQEYSKFLRTKVLENVSGKKISVMKLVTTQMLGGGGGGFKKVGKDGFGGRMGGKGQAGRKNRRLQTRK